jgi:hypothetical protein
MNAGGVDPAVVEVEEGTDRQRVVRLLVAPATRAEALEVGRREARRVVIDPVDETEERLVLVVER